MPRAASALLAAAALVMDGMFSSVDSPPIRKASAALPTTNGSSVVPSAPPFAAATTIGAYVMPLRVLRSPASATVLSKFPMDVPSHERISSAH